MKKIIALTLSLACMLTSFSFTAAANAETTPSTVLYVAVDGNNSNSGTADSPLATIEGARDKIREIKKTTGLPAGGITVYVKNGTYRVKEQINFTEEDSGTKESPIVYKAWGDGKTSLLGGIEIAGKDFEKITNADPNYERLGTALAKENVSVYDLSKDLSKEEYSGKITYNGKEYDPWSIGGRGAYGSGIPGIEVYYNDKGMDAARWPNRADNGKNVYAQFASLVSKAEGNGINYKGAVYKYADKRIEKYATTKNASIVNITGYWSERSSFKIDPSKGEVSLDHAGEYQFHWMANTTYFYEHIFEELDKEGEYYFDYDTGKVYVYGDSKIKDATIKVSLFGNNAHDALLRVDKASYITFSGFDIGLSRVNGIHVTSGTDVTISDCNIFGVGLAGIADGTLYGGWSDPYLRGRGYGIYGYDCGKEAYQAAAGYNHNYINNHVYNTGIQGVVIRAGDRIDLDAANHTVLNCEINNTGRFEQSFGAAVTAYGVGVNVIGNTLHDAPFSAIYFATNDSVIEYNDIYNCMNEGNDMGVLYGSGWDASICAGTEIRYNYIHDVDGTLSNSGIVGGGDIVGLKENVARRIGIYSDDGKPFLEMHHNIFANMPIGIVGHGGAEHNMNDNIFINVRKPIWIEGYVESIKAAYEEKGVGGMWSVPNLGGAEYGALDNPAWREKHPEVFKVKDELTARADSAWWGGHDIKGNYSVFYTNPDDCNATLTFYYEYGLKYARVANNTFTTSTEGFADVANGDYSFTENSKVLKTNPNLKSIDFKKIGRSKDVKSILVNGLASTSKTLKLSDCNITTKALRLVFNEELTNFTAKLFNTANNEIAVTASTGGKTATVKASVPMSLEGNYYLIYTATSASGTFEGCKKIAFNKIWADDFESYNDLSELGENYNVTYQGSGAKDFSDKASEFELFTRDGNTYLNMKGDQIYLKPKTCGVNATYEIDVLAKDSTAEKPTSANFMVHTNMYPDYYEGTLIQVSSFANAIKYQDFFSAARPPIVHGETYAFIRETSAVKGSPFYAAAFCNGNFLGEGYKETFNMTNADYNTFSICKWSNPDLLIDNMKIYTVTEEDIETTLELKNISATKSEVVLDYGAKIPNGAFTLTKDGVPVAASVSKTNGGKTVVITPKTELVLDTLYEIHVTGVSDEYGRTINGYNQPFMLKKLFADDFESYTSVSDMDSVWNVSSTVLGKDYTVSDFNTFAGKEIYGLTEDGWLVIDGNKDNGAINIKSDDVSQWNKYTLELDVKRDQGTPYYLDIMYHMVRTNGKPNDYTNNFRFGLWQNGRVQTFFTKGIVTNDSDVIFTKDSYHLKLTTKTGNDLQVYKDNEKALSYTYNLPLATYAAGGEIGFKVIGGDNKQYIDNVLVYKLITFDEIPTVPELQNISATKSEVTLDYSAEVTNGTFTLTQGGSEIEASVSKLNDGKTVVITPKTELALDTVYELHASDIFDNIIGTAPAYNKPFILQTLFSDDFSYTSVAEMDKVWNVSDQNLDKDYSVSGFNTFAGKDVYTLENGRLAINGNYKNGAINIKAYDASQWNNYTLEVDIGKDAGKRWWLDIMYHMYRNNKRPNDIRNNFRLGLDWNNNTGAAAYFLDCNDFGHSTNTGVFNADTHHLKFTTTTGYDLQVFKDKENVFSHTYGRAFGNGEIGFKVLGGDTDKQYIDNVVAYKLVELDNTQNNIFVKEATVTETGVTGTYTLAKYGTEALESANVIVAAYGESNKLLGMQLIPVAQVESHDGNFSFECNTPGNIVYVKAYLWNSIGGMTPEALSGSKIIGYQTYE